jgi:DNA-binding response OmpR family regulator
MLSKWGYEVIPAINGDEAWEKLQNKYTPKIAILDWMMPGVDGIEICRRLRRIETTTPTYLILLTVRGSTKDIVEGFEAGADDYITKPFDKDELQARIKAGRRIIDLQAAFSEKEKLQGVLEMAGAVCHEMNQPLQTATILSELILSEMAPDNSQYDTVVKIKKQIDKMGNITRKIMDTTTYKTKDYLKGKIIDIEQASQKEI